MTRPRLSSARVRPALSVLLVLIGAAIIVAGVDVLAGHAWALLLAGAGLVAAGLFAVDVR